MSEEVDIPTVAFEPKPWWENRPSDERVEEILGFIGRTGKPFLWPGQTYNRPPDDAVIVYLAEFQIPKSKLLVPCPCCTPRHPKYHHGMIAYFPNERVIRIMGHDCFKAFNSEGHIEALRKYHGERQRKLDIAFLLDNLGNVSDFLIAVKRAAPIGHAVDELRNRACDVFAGVLRTDLWDHVRTGELRITRTRTQIVQIPGQGEEEREVQLTETYGTIVGQDFLKKRSPRLGRRLDNAVLALQQINFGAEHEDRVRAMTDDEPHQAARLLQQALKTAGDAFKAIEELRQFTSRTTIATLNGWGRLPQCPVHMHIAYDGGALYIGKVDHTLRRIEVPPAYLHVLPPLPKLSRKAAAA
jgi:hypothetical protein